MDNLPIIIAGPTAGGKTDAALALAKITGGDIISSDSRQVYKLLCAGTAKPQGVWRGGVYYVEGVPYHLVDFLDINETFDVSKFCAMAADIKSRQLIFAGGTGMYLQGFFAGMDKLPPSNKKIRAELETFAAENGKEALHKRLREVDAASAAQIPAGNIQRVMRALEIFMITGKPASALRTGKNIQIPPQKARFFYLNWDKEVLNKRIALRTQNIFAPMVTEAQKALAAGYRADSPGLRSLGYAEAIAFLEGKITQEQAVERITILTRQYAKRQRTWFARYDDIIKINLEGRFDAAKVARRILEWKPQR